MKRSHIHFMGIGGQGISAVAQMTRQTGEKVTGCDQRASATTRALERAGIAIQVGHSVEHLQGVDRLVISPAVPALDSQNVELMEAQARDIDIVTWQELLGELMREKCVLSISGVHGKGTTTAMLSLALVDAGLDPTCEIGAVVPRFGANYRLGTSEYFVNEADEFNHNFWHYHPRVTVVTSIEFEHPEFFADYNAFLNAFEHFIRGMDMRDRWPVAPTLLLNANSPGCLDLRKRLNDWPGKILTYSVEAGQNTTWDEASAYTAYEVRLEGETSFRVRSRLASFPEDLVIRLQLPGLHNVENALAALAVAHLVGVDIATIARTLEGFNGIRRRYEIRHNGPLQIDGRVVDIMLIDDYAHHPTAIALTLEATRQRYPERRLVAVYQPHMYSRTKTFFEQFVTAFDAADITIIADIFPARERDTGLVHSRDLVEALSKRPDVAGGNAGVLYGEGVQETKQLLSTIIEAGDVVVIMGAGDIYTVTEDLLVQSVAQA